MDIIINNIKRLCKDQHINLSDLANRLGIQRNALYITLKNDNIKLSTLKKIADQIGCSIEDIFTPAAAHQQQHTRKKDSTFICPVCGADLTIIASEDPHKKEL